MKKIIIFTTFVCLSIRVFCSQVIVPAATEVVNQGSSYYNPSNNTTTQIPIGTGLVVYNFLYVNLGAGDTLAIDATTSIGAGVYTRNPLQIRNISGTTLSPVIIKNVSNKIVQITQVNNGSYYGLNFKGCSNIKVSGFDGSSAYNLRVKNFNNSSAMGFSFDLSRNIELEYTEIGYVGAQAIQFKSGEAVNGNNAIVDTAYCRQFVNLGSLGNGKFHHNYIHGCGAEGFYIGSTNYDNGDGIAITINTTFANSLPVNSLIYYYNNSWRYLPHFADTILVYNNWTDSTGWDGIQVAMSKTYRVYNNTVTNYGTKKDANQMYGIIIGSPSKGETFNNTINSGSGSAFQCFGLVNRFYNNFISNANLNHKESVWWAINSIYFNDKSCTSQSLTRMGLTGRSQTLFEASHNTIIMNQNDSGRAIMFMQNYANQTVSRCYNNIGVSDIYPSILNNPVITLNRALFIANPQQNNFSNTNNFVSSDIQTINFVNPAANDYTLSWNTSSTVNRSASALTNSSQDNIWLDKNGRSRSIDAKTGLSFSKPSYGCYEVEDTASGSQLSKSLSDNNSITLWPNPINRNEIQQIFVAVNNDKINENSTSATIELIDIAGKSKMFGGSFMNGLFKSIEIDFNQLSKGIYFARLNVDGVSISCQRILIK